MEGAVVFLGVEVYFKVSLWLSRGLAELTLMTGGLPVKDIGPAFFILLHPRNHQICCYSTIKSLFSKGLLNQKSRLYQVLFSTDICFSRVRHLGSIYESVQWVHSKRLVLIWAVILSFIVTIWPCQPVIVYCTLSLSVPLSCEPSHRYMLL